MEFPKSEGDGHTDQADPAMIERVMKEPAETDGHINVAVRVSSARHELKNARSCRSANEKRCFCSVFVGPERAIWS